MATTSRKQREIQEREERFLAVARNMLIERGYLGLTMDRIAAATEYSKGTVYQHFSSKEDLLVALIARSGELRSELFERAATYAGSSRARITAIGVAAEIFHDLHGHHEQVESLLKAHSLREKASPDRLERLEDCEHRCLNVCFGIVRDAVARGDLAVPAERRLEDLTFGLWSLHIGAFALMNGGMPFQRIGFSPPLDALHANAQVLLDGWGWRPTGDAFEFAGERERILTTVFPELAGRPRQRGS